ncbi:MAG TPA: DsbA family protein, partial [Thermoanaerobaculia bacterium]
MSNLTPPVSSEDHVAGPEDAPVTLVEYGDYECPHCGRAFPIVREIQEAMGADLRFVFRHFPLSQIHPRAEKSAEAAEAAGAQGNFWGMHDLLFTHPGALEDDDLLGYASALGLDVDRFAAELESGVHAARVRRDFRSGVRSGVNGTPTFFVNGVRYDAPWDLPTLSAALRRAAS